MKNRSSISISLPLALATGAPALAGPIYSSDFESPHADTAGLWSHGHTTSLGGTYSTILSGVSIRPSLSSNLSLDTTSSPGCPLGTILCGTGDSRVHFWGGCTATNRSSLSVTTSAGRPLAAGLSAGYSFSSGTIGIIFQMWLLFLLVRALLPWILIR